MDYQSDRSDGLQVMRPPKYHSGVRPYTYGSDLHEDVPHEHHLDCDPVYGPFPTEASQSYIFEAAKTPPSPIDLAMTPFDADYMNLNPVEEMTDLTYVLDPVGQILYASGAIVAYLQYTLTDVVGHNIMEFIHQDDVANFVKAFNDCIMNKTNLHHYHRFRRSDGEFIILETNGHAMYNERVLARDMEGNVIPACRCFILSARGHPSRSTSDLDSLFELQLENERYKAELRELGKRYLLPNATSASKAVQDPYGPPPSTKDYPWIPGSSTRTALSNVVKSVKDKALASRLQIKSRKSNSTSTPTLRTPRITPDMSHSTDILITAKTSSMSGSESQFSTPPGPVSSLTMTIRQDLSATGPTQQELPDLAFQHQDSQMRKKNKKNKVEATELHVCTDCGTTDSPEWRKGPKGPKTLCNACGLRHSKKQKKSEQYLQMHHHHNRDPPVGGGDASQPTHHDHNRPGGAGGIPRSASVSVTSAEGQTGAGAVSHVRHPLQPPPRSWSPHNSVVHFPTQPPPPTTMQGKHSLGGFADIKPPYWPN